MGALRLLAEEVIRGIITSGQVAKPDDIMNLLEERANQSKKVKLWSEVLAVFLMMAYIRAEREGAWLLHLVTFRKMIPYYFVAGHINYAWYGVYYVHSMDNLPPNICSHFVKGERSIHSVHIHEVWACFWADHSHATQGRSYEGFDTQSSFIL